MAAGRGAPGARRRRLYEVLADRIVDFVEAQGLTPGQRLPPERLLAAQLGVSRATLSQALVALEVRGVVDVRHGDGVVLNALDDPLAGASAEQLREARVAVESELAALAAERASEQQRAELAELAAGELDDAAIVAVLGRVSGSPVLAALAEQLALAAAGSLDDGSAGGARATAAALLAAVAAGDAPGARLAARERLRPGR